MKRKIAAILAADAAEYSRLVAEDEEGALRQLVASVAVFRASIEAHGGRIFNTAGDAVLAEFQSAVEAVRSAIDIQEKLITRSESFAPNRRMMFRMGISIGDVVENEGDLLGDGVNIAARLQTLSQPGGLAVSRWVQEQVAGKVGTEFRDAGHQLVRNMPAPIHVYKSSIAKVVPTLPADPKASGAPPVPRLAGRWRAGSVAAGVAIVAVTAAFFAMPPRDQVPAAIHKILPEPSAQEAALPQPVPATPPIAPLSRPAPTETLIPPPSAPPAAPPHTEAAPAQPAPQPVEPAPAIVPAAVETFVPAPAPDPSPAPAIAAPSPAPFMAAPAPDPSPAPVIAEPSPAPAIEPQPVPAPAVASEPAAQPAAEQQPVATALQEAPPVADPAPVFAPAPSPALQPSTEQQPVATALQEPAETPAPLTSPVLGSVPQPDPRFSSPAPAPQIVLPPVVTPAPPPVVAQQDSPADRRRQKVRCAEALERAQLGDITADDRTFLRDKCRGVQK